MRRAASIVSSSTYDLPTLNYFVRFNLEQFQSQISCHNRKSAAILALTHLIHNTASGAKQTDLYGIGVQVQNLGNFLDGKALNFFEDEHHTVALVQAFQEALDPLLGLQFVRNILGVGRNPFRGAELLGLLFAKIRFIQDRKSVV